VLDELGSLFWRLGKNRLHAREFGPKDMQSAKPIRLKETSGRSALIVDVSKC
jgi:hypothetical protein